MRAAASASPRADAAVASARRTSACETRSSVASAAAVTWSKAAVDGGAVAAAGERQAARDAGRDAVEVGGAARARRPRRPRAGPRRWRRSAACARARADVQVRVDPGQRPCCSAREHGHRARRRRRTAGGAGASEVVRSVSPTMSSSPSSIDVAGSVASSCSLRAVSPTCTVALRPAIAATVRSRSVSGAARRAGPPRRRARGPPRRGRPARARDRARPTACEWPKSSWMPSKSVLRLAQAVDGADRCGRSRAAPNPTARASCPSPSDRRRAGRPARMASAISPASAAWPCWNRVQASRPWAQRRPAGSPISSKVAAALRSSTSASSARPGVERAPGQVLAGPGHAAAVVERLEPGERLLEQPGGGGVLVAEQGGEPSQAQHLGLAGRRRRARRRPRPPPRGPRPTAAQPDSFCSTSASTRRARPRSASTLGAGLPALLDGREGVGSAPGRSRAGPARARARPVRNARWRGPWAPARRRSPSE